MLDVPLETHPLDFNPAPNVVSVRALARYNRLVEAREAGQEVSDEEIEQYRIAAFGRTDNA